MYFRELRTSCPDFWVKKWLACRLDDRKFEFDSLKWKEISFRSQSRCRPRNHVSIPGMGKRFISSEKYSDWLCRVQLTLQFNCYGLSLSGGKATGTCSWPLTPSIAEVRNEWNYTSTPPMLSRPWRAHCLQPPKRTSNRSTHWISAASPPPVKCGVPIAEYSSHSSVEINNSWSCYPFHTSSLYNIWLSVWGNFTTSLLHVDRLLFPRTVLSWSSPSEGGLHTPQLSRSCNPTIGSPITLPWLLFSKGTAFEKIWMKTCIVEIPACSAVLWDSAHNYWCNPALLCFVRDLRQ